MKVFPTVPLPVTEQVAFCGPQIEVLFALGVAGTGLIVIALVVAVFVHPVVAFVAVTV